MRGGGGIQLRDIAGMTADSTSAFIGLKMLWARVSTHELSRKERAGYEYVYLRRST